MINLLPNETKQQLRAAHTNAVILKYILITLVAVIFMASVYGVFYMILVDGRSTARLQVENYDSTNSQLNDIKTNLSSAKNIIDRQVKYSNLILEIASILPASTSLERLVVDNNSINLPITMKIQAKSNEDLNGLQNRFTNSKIFSNFSITTDNVDSDSSEYPVAAQITVTINKGALNNI